MFAFIGIMRRRHAAVMQELQQEEDEANKFDYIESDDDTDDEAEAETKAKRAQNKLYYSSLKNRIYEYLGFKKIEPLDDDSIKDKKPDDYWYNDEYHTDKIIFVQKYLSYVSKPAVKLLLNENFNNYMIGIIIIAGMNVGVQTYPVTDGMLFFEVLDAFILAMFMLEAISKIFAEGLRPLRFFYGPEWKWNNFDFLIIVFSLPIWSALFAGGSSVAILRLVRLARLGKLIKKIPQLQMIMSGLIGGLSSIGYILLLLFLVFYLYAIIGFYLYSQGDPFHFGSLPIALLILFRISLLENWSDIMYVNIFGCDYYSNVYVSPEQKTPRNKMFWCDNPSTHYYDAPIYFISFVVISAFVMLSLFIGAITMSMSESMEELKTTNNEKKRAEAFERNAKKMQMLAAAEASAQAAAAAAEAAEAAGLDPLKFEGPESDIIKDPENIETNLNKSNKASFGLFLMKKIVYPVCKILGIKTNNQDDQESNNINTNKIQYVLKIALGDIKSKEELEGNEVIVNENQSIIAKYYILLGDYSYWFVEHPNFSKLMTFIICLAGLNVGAQTDLRLNRIPAVMDFLSILDIIILAFFTLEVVLKLIGEKMRPLQYFKSNWNKFDFLIVVGSYLPGVGSGVTVLRLLRLLRVLKLVKRLPQLAVIINALINGLVSIGYIGVILFLVFYVFAILGIILFGSNDPWHFGNLHLALISLFRTATLDNVSAVMFTSMYGCDVGGMPDVYGQFPEQCVAPSRTLLLTCAYTIVFVIIAAQILLTLFIGVISTSMDEAREAKEKEMRLEEEIQNYAEQRGLSETQIKAFNEVFEMLDLDGEGLISDKELKLGLIAIQMQLTDDEITELTDKVDPNDEGVNLVGFIKFMCMTPKYKDGAAGARLAYILKQKEERMKRKKTLWQKMSRAIVKMFPFLESDDIELQHEAALVLQDVWRARCARKAAQADIEMKKLEMKMQEENNPSPRSLSQTSLLNDEKKP